VPKVQVAEVPKAAFDETITKGLDGENRNRRHITMAATGMSSRT